ncbi:MAG: flagellar basal body P-ring formation chaperone FlgA [Pseudomonadota bacterium]
MSFSLQTGVVIRILVMIVGVLISILGVARSCIAGVQLSIRADVMVSGVRVTLADVTTLENTDQADNGAWELLKTIDLGAAPRPGYTDRYSRNAIERIVRARGFGRAITWKGAEAVRVERIASVIDPSMIVDHAQTYLRELLAQENRRVVLQLSAPLPDLPLPLGKMELKARAIPPAHALHRRVTVWVDIIIDGIFVRSVTVPFNVQVHQMILVAKHDLLKGIVPPCDALQLREQDVAALTSAPFPADCTFVRGTLKRTLFSGEPLLKTSLQTPIAVTQGDSVSLQFVAGALLLESRAIALANAEVGQRIHVRPSASTEAVKVSEK